MRRPSLTSRLIELDITAPNMEQIRGEVTLMLLEHLRMPDPNDAWFVHQKLILQSLQRLTAHSSTTLLSKKMTEHIWNRLFSPDYADFAFSLTVDGDCTANFLILEKKLQRKEGLDDSRWAVFQREESSLLKEEEAKAGKEDWGDEEFKGSLISNDQSPVMDGETLEFLDNLRGLVSLESLQVKFHLSKGSKQVIFIFMRTII